MNKCLLVILFFCVFSYSAYSQFSLGLATGYVNNHLKSDIGTQVFTTIKNGNGIGFGITGRYEFKKIGFEISAQYLQKNYSIVRTGNYQGIYNTFFNSYFQVPASISLEIYKKSRFSFFINGGGYLGYWISSSAKGNIPNIFNVITRIENGESLQYLETAAYKATYKFNSLKDNRIEIGWVAGLGLNYEITKQGKLLLNCKYYQSLTDQQKEYITRQIARHNQTLFISLGYSMEF